MLPDGRSPDAWPLLSRVSAPPQVPARPFGLGCCFDLAPSGNNGCRRAAGVSSQPGAAVTLSQGGGVTRSTIGAMISPIGRASLDLIEKTTRGFLTGSAKW